MSFYFIADLIARQQNDLENFWLNEKFKIHITDYGGYPHPHWQ